MTLNGTIQFFVKLGHIALVYPGFPVGGCADLVGRAATPDAVTLRKFCMSKPQISIVPRVLFYPP